MYQPTSPSPSSPSPDPNWPPARSPQAEGEYPRPYPPAPQPTYLPAPVPPPSVLLPLERAAAVRSWLRIPIERPFWTPVILAVLVGVFILTTLRSHTFSIMPTDIADSDELSKLGAKINAAVIHGEWWRLITATFLHAGLLHIASNGYALYIIGMDLEAFVGRARFLAIYAISGLAGSVASFAFSPLYTAGVGASGAIFGLIGALAVYFGLYRGLFGKRGNMQFWNIILIMALNLGFGFSGILPIDNSAHVGGLLAGALAGYILCPRYALGEWETPNVRALVNVNKGRLPWIATAILALIVVFTFFVVLLLFTHGFVTPH